MSAIDISIIVPTYKEHANIVPLTESIFKELKNRHIEENTVELIIVDDNSKDGTEELIKELQIKYPIRVIVRTTERGLSSAVVRGFDEAKGKYLLCMDADLQHPPESLSSLVNKLEKGNEFVIGTRYYVFANGNSDLSIDKDWPWYRRVLSSGARLLARPLTPLSDPMTGFFGITQQAYLRAKNNNNINIIGFKIALELYIKAKITKHAEIPIQFGIRLHGSSKLTSAVMFNYVKHLIELYQFKYYSNKLRITLVLFCFLFFLCLIK